MREMVPSSTRTGGRLAVGTSTSACQLQYGRSKQAIIASHDYLLRLAREGWDRKGGDGCFLGLLFAGGLAEDAGLLLLLLSACSAAVAAAALSWLSLAKNCIAEAGGGGAAAAAAVLLLLELLPSLCE